MYNSHSSDNLLALAALGERRSFVGLRLALAWALIFGLFILALLAGCSGVMDVRGGKPVSRGARWTLLPFQDYGETPQAGARAEELASSLMRVRWNVQLEHYPATKESAALVDLDEQQRYEKVLEWARDQGFAYGLTGSVQEWRYRNSAEGEAAVGLSLRVIDIQSGRPEWLATAARSGVGAQTISGVAEKLLSGMVAKIKVE